MMTVRSLSLLFALVVLAAPSCGGGHVAPARPSSGACRAYVDHEIRPRVTSGAIFAWTIEDGSPGYEYTMRAEIDAARTLSFVDVMYGEPGPNGLADRTLAPRSCFTRHVQQAEIDRAVAAFTASHLCAQKVEKPEPDTSPNRLEVHLGEVDCEVYLDRHEASMTPDGRAAFAAVQALIAREGPTPE